MVRINGISVIIPHYGDPAHALSLVDILNHQIDAPPLEIIVTDDCSPIPFPEIEGAKRIRREVNGGFGSAVNTGASHASFDHLLVLNSDLLPTDTFIQELVKAAEPLQPAVVAPALLNEQGVYQWAGRKFPTNTGYFIEWLTILARFRETTWWHRFVGHDLNCVPGVLHRTDWVVGAAMLFPTDKFRELGGFDESFYMYCEEIDIQRRMSQKGVDSFVAGSVSVVHVGGKSTDPDKALRWMMRSRMHFSQKWGDNPGVFRLMITIASLMNFVWNTQRQLRGIDVNAREVLKHELSYVKEKP